MRPATSGVWFLALASACSGKITGEGARPDGAVAPEVDADCTDCETGADAAPAIALPEIAISVDDGLFSEDEIRPLVEAGVTYELARAADKFALPPGTVMPGFTIVYNKTIQDFCFGSASDVATYIKCPHDYPLAGDNQNFVTNLTIHEVGHIVGLQLLAPGGFDDACVSEGLATYLAGRYWMNFDSTPVDSFRTAARDVIAAGTATTDLSPCHQPSDPYYKVYASLFEFLESDPDALRRLATGATTKAAIEDDWRAWLEP
jgi:hypothetical protein